MSLPLESSDDSHVGIVNSGKLVKCEGEVTSKSFMDSLSVNASKVLPEAGSHMHTNHNTEHVSLHNENRLKL
jgi:hypothetical protein